MKTKEFFSKIVSLYLLGHLTAMALVLVALFLGVKYGLEWYTHHGEGIKVPKVEGLLYATARSMVLQDGLNIMVTDSGYNKRLPANCVLAQNPGEGTMVKQGHTVYVTLNAPSSPSFPIPDVIDNSSYREAEAKLMAMGFKLLPPKKVVGEKDWVYGVICRGRRVTTGDMVSIETPLTLIIGSGMYDSEEEDLDIIGPDFQPIPSQSNEDDEDDFEEVREP